LRGEIVPRVKEAPGFVAGYWVSVENGDQGRGTIVFESKDAALAAAEQIRRSTHLESRRGFNPPACFIYD
jgi:hypothetical protein